MISYGQDKIDFTLGFTYEATMQLQTTKCVAVPGHSVRVYSGREGHVNAFVPVD